MNSVERRALNEGTFRDANEEIEKNARETIGVPEDDLVPMLCECPREDCTQIILVTLREYEAVRANPKGGLAAVGHEDEEIERVLERNDRFIVTEKVGEAGDVHVQTDPRRDDERARRIGKNEALYRAVNERVSELNQPMSAITSMFAVACECGDIECADQIEVPRDTYEKTRSDPVLFIVKPGHEINDVEDVIEDHTGFVVIAKRPGPPHQIAVEADTRKP